MARPRELQDRKSLYQVSDCQLLKHCLLRAAWVAVHHTGVRGIRPPRAGTDNTTQIMCCALHDSFRGGRGAHKLTEVTSRCIFRDAGPCNPEKANRLQLEGRRAGLAWKGRYTCRETEALKRAVTTKRNGLAENELTGSPKKEVLVKQT